jgi:dihydropteroate synthase
MARALRAELGGVSVGDGLPVAVMGVVNVSPDSFHPGSVYQGDEVLLRAAHGMVEAGAALIDVGARSTAPYHATAVDEDAETRRLGHAVGWLASKLPVPVSADTPRSRPARAALEAGARIINDVGTLRDPGLARLVGQHGAGLILMASPPPGGVAGGAEPAEAVRTLLAEGLERAARAGIPVERIAVDPGIGFFRGESVPWHEWDARVLADLAALRPLGRPLCVGVSRKSFLGAILDRPDPADRLSGSLAATAIAVARGAALIRTHDVAQTRDAVRVAERLREAGGP